MKRFLAIWLCFAVALFALAGCGGEQAQVSATPSPTAVPTPTETPEPSPTEPPVTLTMASAGTLTGTNKGDALEKAVQDLKTWSGGSMAIDFYEGGEKGTDAEIIEAVKTGAITIYAGDASMMQQTIPQLAVLDIPMMFTSIESCNAVLGGAFSDMAQPLFNEAGMQLVGVYSTSFRQLTCSAPIAAPADLKGIRMTTSKSPYNQLFWRTLGCNVLPLERSQVHIALKQGMHKAQEDVYDEIYTLKLYDVQSALIKTRHTQPATLLVMNKAAFDAFTDEQKGWLDKFMKQLIADDIAATAEDETEQETAFGKKKMTVSEPAAELAAALKAAVQPVIESMKEAVDPAFVDSYIAACQAQSPAPTASAEPETSETPQASQ